MGEGNVKSKVKGKKSKGHILIVVNLSGSVREYFLVVNILFKFVLLFDVHVEKEPGTAFPA